MLTNPEPLIIFCQSARQADSSSFKTMELWKEAHLEKKQLEDLGIEPLKKDMDEFKSHLAKKEKGDSTLEERTLHSLFALSQRFKSIEEKVSIPALKNNLYELSKAALLNSVSKYSSTNFYMSPKIVNLAISLLTEPNNKAVVIAYAECLAKNTLIPLVQIANAYKTLKENNDPLAKEILINALNLSARLGAKTAIEYLHIQAFNPEKAAEYILIKRNTAKSCEDLLKPGIAIDELRAQKHHLDQFSSYLKEDKTLGDLQKLLDSEDEALGFSENYLQSKKTLTSLEAIAKKHPKDLKLQQFCLTMSKEIEAYKHNYQEFTGIQKKLEAVHQSLTSPEFITVTKIINKFEYRAANHWVGIGNQKKADNIRAALYDVELIDRIHVVSNPDNLASCKKVKEQLATHRIFVNPLNRDEKTSSLAKIEAFKQFKQHHKEQTNQQDLQEDLNAPDQDQGVNTSPN